MNHTLLAHVPLYFILLVQLPRDCSEKIAQWINQYKRFITLHEINTIYKRSLAN